MSKRKVATPILDRLRASGVIWEENGAYVGKASDGVTVALGDSWVERGYNGPAITEEYLVSHPTPDMW